MAKSAKMRPNWLLPLILAIAVATPVGVYAIYNSLMNPMPDSVSLTGTISSSDVGYVADKITFTCQSSGNDFVSNVSGGNPGTYAVTLPNGHSYKVSVAWKSSSNVSDVGILDLYSRESSLERSWFG